MDRRRRDRTLLLALLLLGVALRLRQYAACPSYWYDEAYLLANIFHKSYLELLGPLRDGQAAPPLFLWMLRGLYLSVGGSEWWMRLPALAAALAGLFVMAPLARRVAGRRAGLWAIALCVLGHHAIAHAGEVKPYTLDFLMTEMILLAALRRARVALCVLAAIAPWLSYPSVFVLGAVSLSLLVDMLRRCRRSQAIVWLTMSGLFVLSSFILWRTAARHQATSVLRTFWTASFVDLSSPSAATAWIVRCLNEIGNYGTREMGLPLLVLALFGAVSLGRRSPSRLVLLAGPIILALFASALHRYPLGGRLLFFLTPCMWLLAARGLAVLIRRLPARRAWVGWVIPAALLIPATGWAGRRLFVVTPRCQFREAFAFVESQRKSGDVLWVSHPQVYEVYYGQTPDLSAYSPPEMVAWVARTGRLWMICVVAGTHARPTAPETMARVRAAPCAVLMRRHFRGVHVILYAPLANHCSFAPIHH